MNFKDDYMFPTVAKYNRIDNFKKYDVETLFFAFYYQ